MTRYISRFVVLLAVLPVFWGVLIPMRAVPIAQVPVPSFSIDLAEVRIEEGRIDDGWSPGSDRDIYFDFLLERPPVCDASRDRLTYTVLIDADLSLDTGKRLRAFPELGIERQAAVRCDGAAGQFVSRSGKVAVLPPAAGTTEHILRLTMRLSGLPSHEFNWVALARHGSRYVVAPASGEPVWWATTERGLW